MQAYEDALIDRFLREDRGVLAIPSIPVVQQPTAEMPTGGFSFSRGNTAAVVLPAIGTDVTVVSLQVPEGYHGVITGIANQFVGGGWTEGTGDLLWRIVADGAAVRGYETILATLGTMSAPGDRSKNPIRIFENQLVELILNNVAVIVSAQALLGLFTGYFYPIGIEIEGEWF